MDHLTPESAEPPKKSIWPIFVGTFVIFIFFALLVQWLLASNDPAAFDEVALRAEERHEILSMVEEENQALTTGYAWVDQDKGIVRIPLERAMDLTVEDLAKRGAPHPAYPIDPNVPLGSAIKPGGLATAQPTPPPFKLPPSPSIAPNPPVIDPSFSEEVPTP